MPGCFALRAFPGANRQVRFVREGHPRREQRVRLREAGAHVPRAERPEPAGTPRRMRNAIGKRSKRASTKVASLNLDGLAKL